MILCRDVILYIVDARGFAAYVRALTGFNESVFNLNRIGQTKLARRKQSRGVSKL